MLATTIGYKSLDESRLDAWRSRGIVMAQDHAAAHHDLHDHLSGTGDGRRGRSRTSMQP